MIQHPHATQVQSAPTPHSGPQTSPQLSSQLSSSHPRASRIASRARAVFGDRASAGVWCHCPNCAAFGHWISPSELARQSEAGCDAVLAELERIAHSTPVCRESA